MFLPLFIHYCRSYCLFWVPFIKIILLSFNLFPLRFVLSDRYIYSYSLTLGVPSLGAIPPPFTLFLFKVKYLVYFTEINFVRGIYFVHLRISSQHRIWNSFGEKMGILSCNEANDGLNWAFYCTPYSKTGFYCIGCLKIWVKSLFKG